MVFIFIFLLSILTDFWQVYHITEFSKENEHFFCCWLTKSRERSEKRIILTSPTFIYDKLLLSASSLNAERKKIQLWLCGREVSFRIICFWVWLHSMITKCLLNSFESSKIFTLCLISMLAWVGRLERIQWVGGTIPFFLGLIFAMVSMAVLSNIKQFTEYSMHFSWHLHSGGYLAISKAKESLKTLLYCWFDHYWTLVRERFWMETNMWICTSESTSWYFVFLGDI